jgi:hypothetical protein
VAYAECLRKASKPHKFNVPAVERKLVIIPNAL